MLRLIIGNKLYSSWSMRPWLVLKAAGLPFEEEVIPLDQPDTRARILEHSPAGKVPVLIDDDLRVWETLAIIEYLADKHPEAGIWPADRKARAHARAISNEMHAGFQALRQACPMNLGKRMKPKERGEAVRADVARIVALWAEARARFGRGGPFLFGPFTAADAMYAPVVSRLDTYQIEVDAPTRAYMHAVMSHPAFIAWRSGALREPWTITKYDVGETPADVFHQPKR